MRRIATAVLLWAISVPALAAGVEPLRDSLAKMPESVLTLPTAVQFSYVDVAALHAIAGHEGLNQTVLGRAIIGSTFLPAYKSLETDSSQTWSKKSHIDRTDLLYLAGFGAALKTIAIWGLNDDTAADALIDALDASDFDAVGDKEIIGNGQPGTKDSLKNDPADPWRGINGRPTFAAAKGNAVIQASTPELLVPLLDERPSMAENAVVTTALAGLDAALDGDLLVQAMLVTPMFGLGRPDTEDLLIIGLNLDVMRERLEARLKPGTDGIPPYLGGFIADAQGEQPAVVISLAYADCETAKQAAEQIGQRWQDTMGQAAQGEIRTASVSAPGGCAAILKVAGKTAADPGNPILKALFDTYPRRQFDVLQIGKAR